MRLAVLLFVVTFLAAPLAIADRSYQKTGKVVEVSDKAIVIATDKEGNWEFKRDAGTRMEGEVKKGGKVTVHYSMTASRVEAKK
jgi:hypothetical protein